MIRLITWGFDVGVGPEMCTLFEQAKGRGISGKDPPTSDCKFGYAVWLLGARVYTWTSSWDPGLNGGDCWPSTC